jgi:hypothetical protein
MKIILRLTKLTKIFKEIQRHPGDRMIAALSRFHSSRSIPQARRKTKKSKKPASWINRIQLYDIVIDPKGISDIFFDIRLKYT